MKYLSASLSNTTFSVFNETILIPTRPCLTSGTDIRCRILACRLSSVWPGAIDGFAVGDGVGVGVPIRESETADCVKAVDAAPTQQRAARKTTGIQAAFLIRSILQKSCQDA